MEINTTSTAVVAVHFERDIVAKDGTFGDFFFAEVERRGVLPAAKRVLQAARAAEVPVLFARVCFSEGHPELHANSPLLELVAGTKCLVDGTPGAEIVPEVAPQGHETVVDHHRINPTVDSQLIPQLRERGAQSVLVFGVSTNVSVEATARSLSDAGFDAYVVEDACSAGSPEAHAAAIETMGLVTRGVVGIEEVVQALGAGVRA